MSEKDNWAWLLRYTQIYEHHTPVWRNVAIFSSAERAKEFADAEHQGPLVWDSIGDSDAHAVYRAHTDLRTWQIRRYQLNP